MKVRGLQLLFVALLVVALVAAFVVPMIGAAPVGDGSVGIVCQSGHACGGRLIASITPTPEPAAPDIVCQCGTACGG
jgi:hypothetical protein